MTLTELTIIKEMARIIRELDNNNEYSEYWLNDEDYIPILEQYNLTSRNIVERPADLNS